ncbi:serine/threonine-protein kinase 32C [Parasteatoda tepidariorum]|uniref:serine/threonine-protein kinase 32C n=1 Tax=Parasteatoda tepidariorum TaxID=114398 RepID=UPI00077F9A24|nr:serine/threonine-protein kinase 32C [Parasteatoda tepidariorum]
MGMGQSCKKKKKKFSITQIDESGAKPVTLDDFQILRAIGKGSFGKVCIVQKKDTMKMYAMKYMNKSCCIEKDAFKNVLKEIEILIELEHPFLVNLWFTFQDEEDMFMVTDLLLGGDLRYHLQQSSSNFDQDRVTLYICEIALVLDYLRSKRILHRDIKPDNILIDDTGHVHITDFNIATNLKEGEAVTSVSGTKPYMAPEVVACAIDHTVGYSFAADWWSLGITAYEMACKMRPYGIHSDTSMEEIHSLIHNSCIRIPRSVDKGLASLINELLCINPKRRISSIRHMKRHHYLKPVDFNAVYNRQIAPSFVPCKNQLNCDPTFELEEMIIESNPLHKKKKRLSKRNKAKTVSSPQQLSEDDEYLREQLDSIQKDFILYNRESELQNQKIEAKRKLWEEELAKIVG